MALAWRFTIREAFQLLFQKGYAIVNLKNRIIQFMKRETIPLKPIERGDL